MLNVSIIKCYLGLEKWLSGSRDSKLNTQPHGRSKRSIMGSDALSWHAVVYVDGALKRKMKS